MNDDSHDLTPLFETILKSCPAPEGDAEAPLQIMVTTLDHDDYLGKIAIGRIVRGFVRSGQQVGIMDGEDFRIDRIGKLFTWQGMKRVETNDAKFGDIIALAGFKNINIGETVTDPEHPERCHPLRSMNPHCPWYFTLIKVPLQDGKATLLPAGISVHVF
mgnify:CR=1 FL=1